jgi:hypothetical protein
MEARGSRSEPPSKVCLQRAVPRAGSPRPRPVCETQVHPPMYDISTFAAGTAVAAVRSSE